MNPSQTTTQSLPRRTWFARPALLGFCLVVLACVTYAPIVRNSFIWDDDAYVTQNATLRSLEGLWAMWFVPLSIPQYYPLVHSTFWLEYHLWGLEPLGYHLVNLALHATSAVLLWRLLCRLQVPGAFLAAAIFAVHPVQVESVVWVTERKNVLSLALVLGAMLCYLRFAPFESQEPDPDLETDPGKEADTVADTGQRWNWYLAALALFLCALLSKTVVATLPAVLLVIVWWKRGRITLRDVVPLLPFFALGMGFGLFTVWLERTHVGAEGEEWDFTPIDRVLIAGRALWFYAGKLAWPRPLIFFYERWVVTQSVWWQYLFPLTALATMGTLFVARDRVGRGPLAAVLIFAGVLMPALGFFNVYPFRYSFVADHFQYHASLALIALAGAGGAMLASRISGWQRRAAQATGGLLVLGLAATGFRQTLIYENLETLYRDTIAKNPTGVVAYVNLGSWLSTQGRPDEALSLARKAITLAPKEPGVHNNLGAILLEICKRDNVRGPQLEEAIAEFNEALKISPNYVAGHSNLALAMIFADRLDDAVKHLAKSLEINPRDARTLYGLATLHVTLKKPAEAKEYFRQALARRPDYVEALYGLGLLLSEEGQVDQAVELWQTALRVDPRCVDAHYALAGALAGRGDTVGAAEHYAAAAQLRPRYVAALVNSGLFQINLGQFDEAVRSFEEVLGYDPDNADAEFGLALALTKKNQPTDAASHLQRVLELDATRGDAHFELANILVGQKQLPEAIAHYKAAVQMRPDDLPALQNLGAALFVAGELEQAIARFEEVLRIEPNNPQAKANLARARSQQASQPAAAPAADPAKQSPAP